MEMGARKSKRLYRRGKELFGGERGAREALVV
jgi:hypothetical protein